MIFSREFLDELKSKVDLVDLVSEYTELKKTSTNLYIGHCPHPDHNDNDASFVINTQTNSWSCYGCHKDKKDKAQGSYGSDAIAFIEWLSKGETSWIDAVKLLCEKAGMYMPNSPNDRQYKYNYNQTQKYIKDMTSESYEYLYDRGIDDDAIEKWSICYDKNSDRIVFPLHNPYKNIIGFNKRLLSKETKGLNRKYIHSSDSDIFKKSKYFYGLQYIDRSKDYIILTEGVIDVILATMYGVSNVICALGTSLSEYQLEILAKYNKEVIVIYDNDKAGQEGIERDKRTFRSLGAQVVSLELDQSKDEEGKFLIKDCSDYLKYPNKIQNLKEELIYKIKRVNSF